MYPEQQPYSPGQDDTVWRPGQPQAPSWPDPTAQHAGPQVFSGPPSHYPATAPIENPPQQTDPTHTGQSGSPAPTRSRQTLAMLAVNAVLLIAVLGVGGYVMSTTASLNGEIETLQSAQAKARQEQAAAEKKLQDEFVEADLSGKLAQVRALTADSIDALIKWDQNQGTVPFRTVQEVTNTCNAAVLEYNALAARFPAELLGSLPAKVPTDDDALDCAR